MMFGVCGTALVAVCLSGCSSIMDPTNANARAEKMQKAVDAQRHNPMGSLPKSAPQTNP
jgi:uncharacterized protein YceK